MRTTKVDNTTVEYVDEISFAFNPIIVNMYGQEWQYVVGKITDQKTGTVYQEKRYMFGTTCFFDFSSYAQGAFDLINFSQVDYSAELLQRTEIGRSFAVSIDFYRNDVVVNSFSASTFVVWGAVQIGERYNGSRKLTWFKNYPFTVPMYSPGNFRINVLVDGVTESWVNTPSAGVWNLMMGRYAATKKIRFTLQGSQSAPSVWDITFDYTFNPVSAVPSEVDCIVDDSCCGVYLRWINRHGWYCYWLFKEGDENRTVTDDGEFIRNNMVDYSYVNGYHGGTGRKQRKVETKTVPVCAPLVKSDTYDFLYELSMSPAVDMFRGYSDDGTPQWMAVNIAVGSYLKTKKSLQDFVATIIMPETRIPSL